MAVSSLSRCSLSAAFARSSGLRTEQCLSAHASVALSLLARGLSRAIWLSPRASQRFRNLLSINFRKYEQLENFIVEPCASVSCERAAPTLLLAAPVARSRPSGLPFASRAECCAGSHALAPRTLHRRITLRPKKKKKRCHLPSLFDSASPCMLVA